MAIRTCAVALLLVLSGCQPSPPPPSSGDTLRFASGAEIEANARVRLPAGTTLLFALYESRGRGQDIAVYAQLRLDLAAYQAFRTDNGLPEPAPGVREITNGTLPGSDTWQPDRAQRVAGMKDEPAAGVHRRFLVDLDHPGDVTVYLVANRT